MSLYDKYQEVAKQARDFKSSLDANNDEMGLLIEVIPGFIKVTKKTGGGETVKSLVLLKEQAIFLANRILELTQ